MNKFQDIFDAQKALFASGITRTYEWRVDQLDRMARMIRENEGRFQKAMAKDFKTASQEYIFETGASAGESEHPTLSKGGANDASAVTELQQKQVDELQKDAKDKLDAELAEEGG